MKKEHDKYNKHLSEISWKGREKKVEKQIALTTKNLEMVLLNEQFFKLIGWENEPNNIYPWLHPDKDYPDRQFFSLPDILSSYDEFFRFVIDEMQSRGFNFKAESGRDKLDKKREYCFWFIRVNGPTEFNFGSTLLIAGVKSAIKALKAEK